MVRILDADGTLHFSQFKKLAKSGVKYLSACNREIKPSRDMLIGTIAHFILLGQRDGAKPLVVYKGGIRRGKEWEAFQAENDGAEIVTPQEWDEAEHMAAAVRRSPIAMRRLDGARFEVPLRWEENGIPCSTSGVDIIPVGSDLGDLKTTASTDPESFKRHCFNMHYAQQLAFYRRGAIANGIDVRNLFILGVERDEAPEVVELKMTSDLLSLADKTLTLWFEELRRNMLSIPEPETIFDWPGYAQAPLEWDVPSWMKEDDDVQAEAAE